MEITAIRNGWMRFNTELIDAIAAQIGAGADDDTRAAVARALIEHDLPLFPKDDLLANLDDVLDSVVERARELL